ncbi:helix-turn-helix domain-containing protein [uncultured Deefgea sp.]|uniref:helix-turn-helix domain-containing protein n=1 Tax=uncultured Deefgea sp. TaxID=1304914 RepID=UPI00259889E1|nr:helix-turn-helix transcriptional regulator [uncultured Deefgea sp.]
MSTLSKRLKEARQRVGLSQEQLGIQIGLEPASASTRMNRYEQGKRVPDFELIERVAAELKLPAAYFYATEDDEAELLRRFHTLSAEARFKVLNTIREATLSPFAQ